MSVLSQNYVYDNLKSQRYKDAGSLRVWNKRVFVDYRRDLAEIV